MKTVIGFAAVGVLVGAGLIGSHQETQRKKAEVAKNREEEARLAAVSAQLADVSAQLADVKAQSDAARFNNAQLANKLAVTEEKLRYELTTIPDDVIASYSAADRDLYIKLCAHSDVPCRLQDKGAAHPKGGESRKS